MKHAWQFTHHFRARSYSWHGSALAAKRLKEAVAEIKQVGKQDPVLAAEGLVRLCEKLYPALERIDSSSGALGQAVGRTISAVRPWLIGAPANPQFRAGWLTRLHQAILGACRNTDF